jgi:hypothetical protein
MQRSDKASSSFLKKRTKKLLLSSVRGGRADRVNQYSKSFLVLFFKKELLALWLTRYHRTLSYDFNH